MIAIFALRLACGLLGCLWLLSPGQVSPRFFRVPLPTALGLTAVAWFFAREEGVAAQLILAAALLLCFVGSVVWHVEGAPFGRGCIYAATGVLGAGLVPVGNNAADDFASAAVLGSGTNAM